MKFISIALIFTLLAGAQQAGQPAAQAAPQAANGIIKFQANTQLVVETVTVKDKSGSRWKG